MDYTQNLQLQHVFFAIIAVIALVAIALPWHKKASRKWAEKRALNRPLNGDGSARFSDRDVQKKIRSIAFAQTSEEFRREHRPVRTQKNQYRSDFLHAVDKKEAEMKKILSTNSNFSDEFCRFVKGKYPDAKMKDLGAIICAYMNAYSALQKQKLRSFMQNFDELTPDEFFKLRKQQQGDAAGVYVLHNCSKDLYYVGQATRLFFRVNQHFTGHGNGDVYADYKYGDIFTIQLVRLVDSGFSDLDLLEKDLIQRHEANTKGYNRTAGNGRDVDM